PDPVAKEDGGSEPALTPINVGNVRPTPMPIGTSPPVMSSMLGSAPTRVAQMTSPAGKQRDPAPMTDAAPKRAISRPAISSDGIGTSNGPGAIASPVFNADQPQAVCCHSALDSSMAPKAAE